MRTSGLLTSILLLLLPLASGADPLVEARRLVMQGRHAAARDTARSLLQRYPNDPEALQIMLAASCELGDRASARFAFRRLAPDVQSAAIRHCSRRGIDLTRERCPTERQQVVDLAAVSPLPPPMAPAPPTDPRRPWRVGFWLGAGATVASIIAVVALTMRVDELEEAQEQLILDRRMRTGDGAFGASADACAEAAAVGAFEIVDVCRRGQRAATASNVMLGVGLVAAAVSGYLYYRGYIKSVMAGPRGLSVAF
jgi:hypothetical protein